MRTRKTECARSQTPLGKSKRVDSSAEDSSIARAQYLRVHQTACATKKAWNASKKRLTPLWALLITAEQVGLLDHYFQLARFLQPSILVIEDVDLIARSRESMGSACEESLLNKLLNEMDGLREDAEVIFLLTTNRPEQLEAAIASRPGRIDQAIEFPLPDAVGRKALVNLYACGLQVPEVVVQDIVRRTENASGAFIKELMRRSAQFCLQNDDVGHLTLDHLTAALDEMLFSGGSLNVRLLGGPQSGAQTFAKS